MIFNKNLSTSDAELFNLIIKETERQENEIELIASKNNLKLEQILGSGDYFFCRNKNKSKKGKS